jgi:hypothetical protein
MDDSLVIPEYGESMPKAELTSYSVVDLLSWQESGALRISPNFQRRSVWNTPAKGYFIDSVLLEYPVPPVHIRLVSAGGKAAAHPGDL